jgi:membrane-associated phospholipid phosphatase
MNLGTVIWCLIATVGGIDYCLLAAQGIGVTEIRLPLVAVITLCVASRLYRRRSPPIACLTTAVAQITAFSHVGALLTYAAMAATPAPLADALFNRADAAIGFNWLEWYQTIEAAPLVHFTLALAYASVPVQGVGLILYFSFKDERRVQEFLMAAIFAVLLITPIMMLLPAIGAWTQHGIGLVEPWRADILLLRSHTLTTIRQTQGIISFPSFHVILAVLLIYMARGCALFWPTVFVNVLMIVAVPTEGAHYGVDVLGGFAAAFVIIAATRALVSEGLTRRPDRRLAVT